MSIHYSPESFAKIATRHDAQVQRANTDRGFELPKALYVVTIGSYLAFLAVMMATFRDAQIGLVMAICVIYIVMAFGVPALWNQVGPPHPTNRLSWSTFSKNGIQTYTGKIGAGDATLQVLILPVLILIWGVGIALIVATV
jgi:hypothetical protein